ncbi:MAG: HAMP domain-containing histidine kinase [Roseivirga sp.]|nr:HAMP domain-containing histidine kinase [Roseivirga sp.]
MKKISLPALLSILAIFILAIAQFFIIRYAYQLKFGELEFVYRNVYEYAKPFFEVQWESADDLTQSHLDERRLIENGKISEAYLTQLQTSFINDDFISSKIEEYFQERGLLEEVEFSLVMRNISLNINGADYTPRSNQLELSLIGDLTLTNKGQLVYRHIANSEYITTDFDLFIFIPNQTSLLISEMKWVIILSIITFCLISFVAVSNLLNWQKQKQLAAIKDDLIDHISHEFRTPITSINIASDSIRNHGKDLGLSRVMEISELIKRQGSRLQQMIDNLLNTAFLDQNQALNQEVVVADHFLKTYLADAKFLTANTTMKLETMLKADEAKVMVDTFLFESMLNNLMENAIKYNRKSPVIQINSRISNHQYILTITDNGIGIDSAHLDTIFEKFQRFNKASKGLGLGLYHVHKIVTLHKGDIQVDSQPDHGTSFTISFPIYE